MEPNLAVAVIAGGSAIIGGLISTGANYFISRRQFSRSGARLLGELQILEKARALQLDSSSLKAIEDYVRERVEWHTHTDDKRSGSNAV